MSPLSSILPENDLLRVVHFHLRFVPSATHVHNLVEFFQILLLDDGWATPEVAFSLRPGTTESIEKEQSMLLTVFSAFSTPGAFQIDL